MAGFKAKKADGDTVTFNIANRTIIRVLLWVAATFLLLAAISQASYALTLIFIAFFLALALNAPVYWLEKRLPGRKQHRHRTAATAVSFLVVVLALVGFLASIVPPLVRETGNFLQRVPALVDQVRDENSAVGSFIARYDLQDEIDDAAKQVSNRFGDIGTTALTGFGRVAESTVATLTVLVLTFMMLIEGPRWVRFFRDLVPDKRQARFDRLMGDMYRVVKGYVNGQVILAFIAALLILPVLIILDTPYPAALAVIVFIAGLIPLVGHTIGAIVVTLVTLFESPLAAVIILGYYILYQQIENYIIQPRVQANTTNMTPLLVFSAVIIGVSFGGLLGGLVAIPVAGCLRILLIDYLRTKGILEPGTVDTGNIKPISSDTK